MVTSAFWQALSSLGNSKLLLPAAGMLVLTAGPQRWRIAQRWLPALGLVCALTLVSKLAFLGWGQGIAVLDFTGISGHAAVSSAIYPVALSLLLAARWKWPGFLMGLSLALSIAYSRLPLHAHSLSEVVAGSMLGAGASLWVCAGWDAQLRNRLLGCGAALLMAVICVQHVMPGVSTHDQVLKLAQLLSGRSTLYDRDWLSRR
jgi:membrane-associated phospholipid phosphatase